MSLKQTTFAQIKFKIHEVGESSRIDWFITLLVFAVLAVIALIIALLVYSKVQVVDKTMVLQDPATAPVSIDTNTLEKVDTLIKKRADDYKHYNTILETIPDPAR